jgi:hypothetical protein
MPSLAQSEAARDVTMHAHRVMFEVEEGVTFAQ